MNMDILNILGFIAEFPQALMRCCSVSEGVSVGVLQTFSSVIISISFQALRCSLAAVRKLVSGSNTCCCEPLCNMMWACVHGV